MIPSEEELSSIGQVLARLPVEVALGKLIFSAAVLGVLEPALTIAAGLNIQVLVIYQRSVCEVNPDLPQIPIHRGNFLPQTLFYTLMKCLIYGHFIAFILLNCLMLCMPAY